MPSEQGIQAERSQGPEVEAPSVYEDPKVGPFGWNKGPA